jgi:hypothetical protein
MYRKQDKNTGQNINHDNYHYIYLHENGELIGKSKHANPLDFEESTFVKKWWKMDLEWRGDIYNFLISAKLKGGNLTTIDKWMKDWKVTDEDTKMYLNLVGLKWSLKDGIYEVFQEDVDIKGSAPILFDALYSFAEKAVLVN